MVRRRVALALMALAIAAAPAYSQSLGELARREEARRSAGSKSVRTLSNANLKPGEVSSPGSLVSPGSPESPGSPASPDAPVPPDAPASCYMSIRLGHCVTADEMVANSAGKKTRGDAALEQKWRKDAEAIRSQVERTQRSIATLEGVIADGSAGDRKAAEQALAKAQRQLAGFARQWVKLERAAGNQRIPRAWLEPIPTLTTKR